MLNKKRQCPKCHRNLIKQRLKSGQFEWVPKKFQRWTNTFKYWKCRFCQYREADIDKKTYVLTNPGGAVAQ